MVKNLTAMQETWQEPQVQLLGWDDPLEKKMATDSSILAWISFFKKVFLKLSYTESKNTFVNKDLTKKV